MKRFTRRGSISAVVLLGVVAALSATVTTRAHAQTSAAHSTLGSSIAVNATAETITLPLHKGLTATGATTWYVLIDSSNKADAANRGLNYAPRLANALGTRAVQKVTTQDGLIKFPGTVNFAPNRVVDPSKTGFPPTKVAAGALGDSSYSPFITADGHTVLDAPQIANATGRSQTVTNLDVAHNRVTIKLLRGWFDGTPILYVRTEGSAALVSALEESTLAPTLNSAPGLGSDAASSARSAIIPVVNGALSGKNRQGLQSAVLSGKDPLNVTQSFPGQADYTPIWDLHPVVWTPAAIKAGKRVELTSAAQVTKDVKAGWLTSAGTGPKNPSLGGLRAFGAISICSTVVVL